MNIITTFVRCEIKIVETYVASNIHTDPLFNKRRFFYSSRRCIIKDPERVKPILMHICTKEGKLIASSDLNSKLPIIPLSFLELYMERKPNGGGFALIKYINGTHYVSNNNFIDISLFKDNVSIQELIELSKAYPRDQDFGRHIREELLK